MLQRPLADHDFNQIILRGIMRRLPTLDVVTAHESGLSRVPDEELLSWAAHEQRVTITHDQRTMAINAAKVINAGGSLNICVQTLISFVCNNRPKLCE